MAPLVSKIHSITIHVRDLDEALRDYGERLDIPFEVRKDKSGAEAKLPLAGSSSVILVLEKGPPPTSETPQRIVITFQISDLDKAAARGVNVRDGGGDMVVGDQLVRFVAPPRAEYVS